MNMIRIYHKYVIVYRSVIASNRYSDKFEFDSKLDSKSFKYCFPSSCMVRNKNRATRTHLIRLDS